MDTHALIGDRLHVYRRDGSPFWQCATYLAGRNHRTSTKERDLERAKKIAEEWYLNLQVKKPQWRADAKARPVQRGRRGSSKLPEYTAS